MKPAPALSRPRWTKRHALAAVVAAAALLGGTWIVLRVGVLAAAEAFVLGLRDAGPLVFFAAMAVLPAVGFPLMAFTLTAGPVFAPTLGAGPVIAYALLAVVANLLLTYWLATRALRPLAMRLLTYFGFALPADAPAGVWELTLIVRVTPGPPFWAQSYLLGLLRVPLQPYLCVSTGVIAGYLVLLVYGGEALASGNVRAALLAAAGLGVLGAILKLVRKQMDRRKATAALQTVPAK